MRGDNSRIFNIASSSAVMISGVTISNGHAYNGGAIYNDGTLSLSDVVLSGNSSEHMGGAIYEDSANLSLINCTFEQNSAVGLEWDDAYGGAIFHQGGNLSISGSTFVNNAAQGGSDDFEGMYAFGGALALHGNNDVQITNSTFTGNEAIGGTGQFMGGSAYGGALEVFMDGSFTMTNCTVAGNSATAVDGQSYGGGVTVMTDMATHSFTNNIIAQNSANQHPDFGNGSLANIATNNLIGQDESNNTAFVNGQNGNIVGTAASPINPLLDVLADNGGLTKTMALLDGSPAIDTGHTYDATATDQRGQARDLHPDIGAFEVAASNAAPVFTSTANTSATSEQSYSYSITTDDANDDALTITATTKPAWLTLTDNGDGTATLSGTPTNANAGDNAVTLEVTDGSETSQQSFTISVSAINHAPAFTSNVPTSATADEVYTYNITTEDADGDDLVIDATTIPGWLELTDNGDGTATLTGTPSNASGGANAVELTVSDDDETATQSFSIEVTTVNHAPTFTSSAPTSATSETQYSYSITTMDPDGNAVTITPVSLASWLTLTDNEDGTATLTGTPNNSYAGDHAITLKVSDGTNSSEQSFTITVAAINHAPTFTSTAVTTAISETEYTYSITTTDADGDAMTITADQLPEWLSFTDNGDGTATLSGTPANANAGAHAVTLTVSDGTDTAQQSFSIDVVAINHAPALTSTPVTSATSEQTYTYSIAATDADGDALTITADQLPDWLTLTDHGNGTATLTGTPDNADAGTVPIMLQVGDGTTFTTQAFALDITAVNHAPAFSSTPVTSATSEQEYTYTITTSDSDGDDLTITATTLPAWLTLTDNGDGTATLTGTPDNANAGDHEVKLNVFDGADSAEQSFTLNVSAINHAPTFTSNVPTTATSEQAYTYNITIADSDGDTLTITAPTLPAWLTLTDNGDGTATLTGTPSNDNVGLNAVDLLVSDGADTATQSFSIDVAFTNHAPKFDTEAPTTATSEQTFTYQVEASDPDGDDVAIDATTLPEWIEITDNGDGTATLTGTPDNSAAGDNDIVLVVSDGTESTQQAFTLTVTAVNHAPQITSTALTTAPSEHEYSYEITATDSDGDDLEITAAQLPDWLTLTDNGDGTATLTGTPTNTNAGSNAVTISVSDGTDAAQQAFTIDVAAINHAPGFTSAAVTSATSGQAYTYDIAAADSDDDDLAISASIKPDWLALTDNGDGTATLSGTPTNADTGIHNVTLVVSDGTTTTEQVFSISVGAVNHAPAFSTTPITDATAGMNYTYHVAAADSDGDDLTITAPTLPAWMSLQDNGDGTATLSGITVDSFADAPVVLLVSDGTTTTQQAFSVKVNVPPVTVQDGVLLVNGTNGDDTITIWSRGDTLRTVRNGKIRNFAASSITRVQVLGFDGNDTISITAVLRPGYVFGGNGDDSITTGEGDDTLTGGGGKDILAGGGGSDRLNGNGGNDKLDGAAGSDRLYGGDGNDLLTGGTGHDTLRGEAGNDTILARDNASDAIFGGEGINSAQIDALDVASEIDTLLS